jgi:membrane-bound ClpP family serine protease
MSDEATDETPETPVVTVMRISSAIGPITVREIKNGIERSEELGAEAFIVELNTPGGNTEAETPNRPGI